MPGGGEAVPSAPPADSYPASTASAYPWPDLLTYAYCFVIIALLLIDFVPRFYQGDSLSYVTTTWDGGMPAERSWSFGLFANFLLRYTHGYASYIIFQAVVLGAIIAAARNFFSEFTSWKPAYALTAIALSLDPMLELYTRFYMSDFLAAACFMLCLLGLLAATDPDAEGSAVRHGFSINFLGATGAIFLRVAYLPILELTIIFMGLCWWRRLSASGWMRMAAAAAIPILAVGLLVGANSIVFAKRYPHEFFANKLSSLALASVFAPALQIADFEKAGIPVTPEEFARMELGNYDIRWKQTWSNSPNYLKQFLSDRLNADMFAKAVDAAARKLVIDAFLRNPFSIFEVYCRNAWSYMQPIEWQKRAIGELGLPRLLPDQFVDYFNQYSTTKLLPTITQFRSPLLEVFERYIRFYPILLGLGVCSVLVLLLREGARPYVIVLGAALVSDFLAAPLYSIETIPRYLIAAVFLSYLLAGLASLSLLSRRTARAGSVKTA